MEGEAGGGGSSCEAATVGWTSVAAGTGAAVGVGATGG